MSNQPQDPREPTARWVTRHPQLVIALLGLGPAVVFGLITKLTFGDIWPGWFVGVLAGLGLRRAVANRRPDIVSPEPTPTQPWQLALIAVIVVATAVLLVVALSN